MKVGTDGVLLGAWTALNQAEQILDIGTGTGVIALMMAQRQPKALITGIEIDKDSADQAKFNVEQSPWSDRIKIVHSSLQEYVSITNQKFDLIVSNPPFFSGSMQVLNQRKNIARHNILLTHESLAKAAMQLLTDTGQLSVILPVKEGTRWMESLNQYGFHLKRLTEVYPKKEKMVERLLIELSRAPVSNLEKTSLVIQNEGRNDWTPEYIQLLKRFYLKM